MKLDKSKVSIVIPAKDEGQGLAKIINSVRSYAQEIIVVDGHSKDDTKKITRKLGAKYILDHGLGRGDGVRMGIAAARGPVVVLFDADGSHDDSEIPNYVRPILEGKADLVIGSRRKGGSFDLSMTPFGIIRSAGADLMTYLVNLRFGTNFSDILYSFRAIRKSTAISFDLTSDGFEIEQEMVVKCLRKKAKVMEIPSREKARVWGEAKLKTYSGIKLVFSLLLELYAKK